LFKPEYTSNQKNVSEDQNIISIDLNNNGKKLSKTNVSAVDTNIVKFNVGIPIEEDKDSKLKNNIDFYF
jgi:hypothetical protein